MTNQTLTIITFILAVVLVITIYALNKQNYRIKRLEYNNNSLMEILLLLQDGAKLERIETGDDENHG
jgi:hypothetical protein